MQTIIYWVNGTERYMQSELAEDVVSAFRALAIPAYVFPKFLQEQAI